MTGLHRLLIIGLIFNIVLGTVITFSDGIDINEFKNNLNGEQSKWQSEKKTFDETKTDESAKNDKLITQTSAGNPLVWGQILIRVFANGFNVNSVPLSDEGYGIIEEIAAAILYMFRVIFSVFMILEIYMLVFNKKNT